jgi:hypothetical protein
MVTMIRTRLLAGVAAAALATAATVALTASPASAVSDHGSDHEPPCALLHLQINTGPNSDLIHLCI